jgi:hypothetical protein
MHPLDLHGGLEGLDPGRIEPDTPEHRLEDRPKEGHQESVLAGEVAIWQYSIDKVLAHLICTDTVFTVVSPEGVVILTSISYAPVVFPITVDIAVHRGAKGQREG